MSFPADFPGGVPELRPHRRAMDFLPPALAERCESYHADSPNKGAPSMSALAGLGESPICDFFAPLGIRMLVIEDRRLVWWMRDRMENMSVADMSARFANICVGKMSGSAKVLDALYAKFVAARGGEKNPPQADCEFWVVALDIDSIKRDARVYNALTERARHVMRGEMSRPYVLAEIVGAERFGRELENRIPG